MTVASPGPAPKRKRPLPPALAANIWKRGQSGNPAGLSGAYGATVRLAGQAAPAAINRLIELMSSADERVASVACNAVLDRAFGKPRECDLKPELSDKRLTFNPRAYSPADLAVIEAALKLMRAGGSAPAEPEVIPPSDG
jgi:hypothetical protein